MPLKLSSMQAAPTRDFDTVTVLGLEIPLTDDLPFGGVTKLNDLQTELDLGRMGQTEFFMQVFCIFTWRCLDQRDWVDWSWLRRQKLSGDEIREIADATAQLVAFYRGTSNGSVPQDGDEGKAAPARKKKTN